MADNCHRFLRKGSKCAVVGNIQTRSYDATDGTKRYVTEVVAEEVEFVGAKATGNSDGGLELEERQAKPSTTKLEPIDDDQLPF